MKHKYMPMILRLRVF